MMLHMDSGFVFLASAPDPQERGLVGPQSLVSSRQNDHGAGSRESWLHHAWQAAV